MDVSLEDIISNKKGKSRGKAGRISAKVDRQSAPYLQVGSLKRNKEEVTLSMKLVISNAAAGMLIGKRGDKIKKFSEVTHSQILVSAGADKRVVQISGTRANISLAQAMLWEIIAYETCNGDLSNESVDWLPENKLSHQYDTVDVSGTVILPAACMGTIIGHHGHNIRNLSAKCNCSVSVSDKSEETNEERVIHISGPMGECSKATSLILNILASESTSDVNFVHNVIGHTEKKDVTKVSRDSSLLLPYSGKSARGTEIVSAETTLKLSVDDSRVANIIGPNGAVLKEVMMLSGAKVLISPRGEFLKGTKKRTITITGTPASAQTACTMITQLAQSD